MKEMARNARSARAAYVIIRFNAAPMLLCLNGAALPTLEQLASLTSYASQRG